MIKSLAKRAGYNGFIGKILAKILPDAPWASYLLNYRVFTRTHGFRPRLRQPRTLNEWLFARKVTLPREISFEAWVDKHQVKESVASAMQNAGVVCHIARTIHHTTSAYDPVFSSELPRCVIKGTHGSGMTILVQKPRMLSMEEKKTLQDWLNVDYFKGSREPSYRHLTPGVLIEEFLPGSGIVPEDYKFFCFRGDVDFIQHDTGRYIEHRRCLYSTDWKRLPVSYQYEPYPTDAPAPKDLPTMLTIARRLSRLHNFVRVDLYQTDAGVYFGEMTFFPESGLGVFQPPAFESEVCRRRLTHATA